VVALELMRLPLESKVIRVTAVLLLSLLTVTRTGAESLCAKVPSPL